MNHALAAILVLLVTHSSALAQDRQPRPQRSETAKSRTSSMYRLNFTLHIIEDGRDQTRQYALVLEERSDGKIRALIKVPVRVDAETTYVETGVKCDARFVEVEGRARLEVELQYTEIVPATEQTAAARPIHEWQSRVEVSVPSNETAVLSTYDGGPGSRRYQLDVKAEKLR